MPDMSKNNLVTIGIPTYKRPELIINSLKSLEKQTINRIFIVTNPLFPLFYNTSFTHALHVGIYTIETRPYF